MAPLRLMTFNVQMLPLLAVTVLGQSDDAVDRADRVADAILSLPVDEQPDIIAFNEVFAEDGRDRLQKRLFNWPNMVLKLDDDLLEEDSGLMLVSRLPLLTLPGHETVHARFYSDSAGTDSQASKGVGIVQTNRPGDITTIAFTHLQASYETEDEHREIRASQLVEVVGALGDVLGNDAGQWRDVILIGDLNIRGDSGAQTDEWSRTFLDFPIGAIFADGWRSWMHPPGDETDYDRGCSNVELDSGKLQRLDYQCFTRASNGFRVVPHHMFVRLRDQSDHFALESYIAQWVPNCTPSEAIVLADVPPLLTTAGDVTSMTIVGVDFASLDAYQWVYVREPGTYTVHVPAGVTGRLFLDDDISHPITPMDTLDKDKLPPEIVDGLLKLPLVREGKTYAVRRAFYVALTTTASDPGPASITVYKHLGDTPDRAIWLVPHVETWSGFPNDQPLGTDDVCWFKAQLPKTFAGAPRTEEFVLNNPNFSALELTSHDAAKQPVDSVSGKDQLITLGLTTQGGDVALFSLRRNTTRDNSFSIRWISPLSYLALDRPIGFYISDESGPDWLGDDEITLDISMDGLPLFSGGWDSADSGERWPGFVEAIRNRFRSALPDMRRIPFSSDITLSYIESNISAGGFQIGIVAALRPTDPDMFDFRLNLNVPDDVSDGLYTFYGSLSRFPE